MYLQTIASLLLKVEFSRQVFETILQTWAGVEEQK
jgi:hypothetical protein